jgi:hypothetical protein
MNMATTPLKRSKQLRELSHQHHDILLFVWKVRQGIIYGVPPARIGKYCEWFWGTVLKAHLEEEEAAFSSVIPDTDTLMNNLLEDHDAIRIKMNQVIADPSQHDIKRLADIIYYHIRFEERTFFPHIEQTLDAKQLNLVGSMLVHPAIPYQIWRDEFWIRRHVSAAVA